MRRLLATTLIVTLAAGTATTVALAEQPLPTVRDLERTVQRARDRARQPDPPPPQTPVSSRENPSGAETPQPSTRRPRDPRTREGRLTPPASSPPPAAAASATIEDQGVHNALHAAHQNQIVFTRTDLTLSEITESALAREFTLGQPIFFRVYTERSGVNAIALATGRPARDVYADGVHYTARYTVEGQTYDTTIRPWGNPNDHRTWTTWRGQLLNPGPRMAALPGTDSFLELLSRAMQAGKLRPGRHDVTMEVIANTTTSNSGVISAGPVARGQFTLMVPAGAVTPSNHAVCGPGRGGAGSAAIEARALSQSRQFWTNTEQTPVRAVAAGDTWEVTRNEITGIPIERATYVGIYTRGTAFCTIQTHVYREQYMGGGNFSTSTGTVSVNWSRIHIPCACVG
jgi:hypothetical protein